jgi:hypothetical protein
MNPASLNKMQEFVKGFCGENGPVGERGNIPGF